MEIYDLVLDEHRARFSSTEKILMLNLYRKMNRDNITSMYCNICSLSEELMISKIVICRALQIAEDLGLVEKEVYHKNGSKKVRLTIKRGL